MEKAAILIGGVALLAYVTSGSSNDKKQPPIHGPIDEDPLAHHLQAPPRHVLPPPIHGESPGLEHLQAPNRRLLPFYSDPLKMHAPPRHVLPPPIHGEEPGLQHLQAPQRRLLPFESAPIREHAPPRHVLPPPIHSEEPGLRHLQAPHRRLLPPPQQAPLTLHRANLHVLPPLQPADPLKLVPLAPIELGPKLPPKIVGRPWRLQPSHSGVKGYAPCQLQIVPDKGIPAYQNLPQYDTYQSCQAAQVPCPLTSEEGHCMVYWAPLQ